MSYSHQYGYYIEEVRRKIAAVLEDQGNRTQPIDEMTEYLLGRLLSDNAIFRAMEARENGKSTREIVQAAIEGGFGTTLIPKEFTEGLSAESKIPNPKS